MIQIVYWGLEQYTSAEAKGAAAGLVAQSKALLLKEWHGYVTWGYILPHLSPASLRMHCGTEPTAPVFARRIIFAALIRLSRFY